MRIVHLSVDKSGESLPVAREAGTQVCGTLEDRERSPLG